MTHPYQQVLRPEDDLLTLIEDAPPLWSQNLLLVAHDPQRQVAVFLHLGRTWAVFPDGKIFMGLQVRPEGDYDDLVDGFLFDGETIPQLPELSLPGLETGRGDRTEFAVSFTDDDGEQELRGSLRHSMPISLNSPVGLPSAWTWPTRARPSMSRAPSPTPGTARPVSAGSSAACASTAARALELGSSIIAPASP